MKIKILKIDFRKGERWKCNTCPVARGCLRAAKPLGYTDVSVNRGTAVFWQHGMGQRPLRESCRTRHRWLSTASTDATLRPGRASFPGPTSSPSSSRSRIYRHADNPSDAGRLRHWYPRRMQGLSGSLGCLEGCRTSWLQARIGFRGRNRLLLPGEHAEEKTLCSASCQFQLANSSTDSTPTPRPLKSLSSSRSRIYRG